MRVGETRHGLASCDASTAPVPTPDEREIAMEKCPDWYEHPHVVVCVTTDGGEVKVRLPCSEPCGDDSGDKQPPAPPAKGK